MGCIRSKHYLSYEHEEKRTFEECKVFLKELDTLTTKYKVVNDILTVSISCKFIYEPIFNQHKHSLSLLDHMFKIFAKDGTMIAPSKTIIVKDKAEMKFCVSSDIVEGLSFGSVTFTLYLKDEQAETNYHFGGTIIRDMELEVSKYGKVHLNRIDNTNIISFESLDYHRDRFPAFRYYDYQPYTITYEEKHQRELLTHFCALKIDDVIPERYKYTFQIRIIDLNTYTKNIKLCAFVGITEDREKTKYLTSYSPQWKYIKVASGIYTNNWKDDKPLHPSALRGDTSLSLVQSVGIDEDIFYLQFIYDSSSGYFEIGADETLHRPLIQNKEHVKIFGIRTNATNCKITYVDRELLPVI